MKYNFIKARECKEFRYKKTLYGQDYIVGVFTHRKSTLASLRGLRLNENNYWERVDRLVPSKEMAEELADRLLERKKRPIIAEHNPQNIEVHEDFDSDLYYDIYQGFTC